MDEKLESEQMQKRVRMADANVGTIKPCWQPCKVKLKTMSWENAALRTRLVEMDGEITRLNTLMARLEQFDQDINEVRTTTNRQLEDINGKPAGYHPKNENMSRSLKASTNPLPHTENKSRV